MTTASSRSPGSADVERIHQQDACQALNRDPDANQGRGKYERLGGPALREIASLLDRFARDPVDQLAMLVRVVTFHVSTGNTDAHGKNYALLHRSPDDIVLAPLYDTVPTRLWPQLRQHVAMTIDGRSVLDAIGAEHVIAETAAWKLDEHLARAVVLETAEQVRAHAANSSNAAFANFVLTRVELFRRG